MVSPPLPGHTAGLALRLLAFLGFANGLTFWTIRNYKVPDWGHRLIPIVDTAYYHLWMGNNPANGEPMSENEVITSLAVARHEDRATTAATLAKLNQPSRYDEMGKSLWSVVLDDPGRILGLRVKSGIVFFLGAPGRHLASDKKMPDWLAQGYIAIFAGALCSCCRPGYWAGAGLMHGGGSQCRRRSPLSGLRCPTCSAMPRYFSVRVCRLMASSSAIQPSRFRSPYQRWPEALQGSQPTRAPN